MKLFQAERQVLRNAIRVGVIHHGGLAESATALGAFALEQVAASGFGAHDLASGGYLEPLGNGLLRFDAFRTTHSFRFL